MLEELDMLAIRNLGCTRIQGSTGCVAQACSTSTSGNLVAEAVRQIWTCQRLINSKLDLRHLEFWLDDLPAR